MKKKSKPIILLFSLFVLISATQAQKFAYTSEEGKLTVKFPAEYKVEEQSDLESNKMVTIKCAFDKQSFLASYQLLSSLHHTILDSKKLAETGVESFGNVVSAKLLSKSEWKINGQSGLKAIYELTEAKFKIDYRTIIVGHIQYQFFYMFKIGNYNEDLVTKFYKSVKIKK